MLPKLKQFYSRHKYYIIAFLSLPLALLFAFISKEGITWVMVNRAEIDGRSFVLIFGWSVMVGLTSLCLLANFFLCLFKGVFHDRQN